MKVTSAKYKMKGTLSNGILQKKRYSSPSGGWGTACEQGKDGVGWRTYTSRREQLEPGSRERAKTQVDSGRWGVFLQLD